MSEYVNFHYMPLEGKITGKQVLQQTEDAINDLGNKVYNLDVDEERIDEAIEKSEQAIETADAALSAVTTDRSVWKNTVADMKATNIEAGVTAATRGETLYNDGDGAFYVVRQEKSGDVDGEDTVFLDNGNVAERIQSMNIIAKGNNIIFVSNVAKLIDSDALIGNVYGTTGYYSANDGGAGLYSIRTKTPSDVEDGGSIIFLDNGNVAELITNGTVNVKQFGAKENDTSIDNHDAFLNAIKYSNVVDLLGLTFTVDTTVEISIDKTVKIKNGCLYSASSVTLKNLFLLSNATIDITFEDIRFTSVRDKTAASNTDTQLSSNVLFVHSGGSSQSSISLINCNLSQCEYGVKKDDVNDRLLRIVNSNITDSMMPILSAGQNCYISDSYAECVATNTLYHALYCNFGSSDNNDVQIINSTFNNKNQTASPNTINLVPKTTLSDTIYVHITNCKVIGGTDSGVGAVMSTNPKIKTIITSSMCSVGGYGTLYDSVVRFINVPRNKIELFNCDVDLSTYGILVGPDIIVGLYGCKITSVRDSGASYSIHVNGSTALCVVENCNIDCTVPSAIFRVNSGTLRLINNYIQRVRTTTSGIVNANAGSSIEIYGNIANAVDASFPTTNGNFIY